MGVTIWSNDKIKNMSQCGKREEKIVEGEEYEEAKGRGDPWEIKSPQIMPGIECIRIIVNQVLQSS